MTEQNHFKPDHWAEQDANRKAIVMGLNGVTLTYTDLAKSSKAIARLFNSLGLAEGDVVAFCIENRPEIVELAWAAERSGLLYTTISTQLTADEIAYIVRDSGAKAFVISNAKASIAADLRAGLPDELTCLMMGEAIDGYKSFDAEIEAAQGTELEIRSAGHDLLYSSGTTGKPKGIMRDIPKKPFGAPKLIMDMLRGRFGADDSSVYLCPAPLYHAAPLRFVMGMISLGATVVVMPKFDAEEALRLIDHYKITHSQWVPTMLSRMLALPDTTRASYDVSSMKVAIHAAAPCPVEVKRKIIDWWGPVIHEYYGSSEGVGICMIDSEEWLSHEGSVGRCIRGTIHVLDDAGNELPPRQSGTLWVEGGVPFRYLNDPEKTAECYNDKGWLYLTDRKSFMIISGGVNIYPQEIENALTEFPEIADVAVFGVPNPDFGEEVKAVVVLRRGATCSQEDVIEFCRGKIGKLKCPRSVDFVEALPRSDTGKLLKGQLRAQYWPEA
jgi:acyl-CoA synthetase (AMP-forming)/AMP-acid ligase II